MEPYYVRAPLCRWAEEESDRRRHTCFISQKKKKQKKPTSGHPTYQERK